MKWEVKRDDKAGGYEIVSKVGKHSTMSFFTDKAKESPDFAFLLQEHLTIHTDSHGDAR